MRNITPISRPPRTNVAIFTPIIFFIFATTITITLSIRPIRSISSTNIITIFSFKSFRTLTITSICSICVICNPITNIGTIINILRTGTSSKTKSTIRVETSFALSPLFRNYNFIIISKKKNFSLESSALIFQKIYLRVLESMLGFLKFAIWSSPDA